MFNRAAATFLIIITVILDLLRLLILLFCYFYCSFVNLAQRPWVKSHFQRKCIIIPPNSTYCHCEHTF